MTNPALLREERPDDRVPIRTVTLEAFEASELGHHGESDLIDRLRKACSNYLSLVAERGGQVVGHVLFTPVVIRSEEDRQREGMGLGPMAVLPKFQRAGIGTQLVEEGVRRLREARCPFVVVVGHPEFYGRRGFDPASKYGVTCEFEDLPRELFQIAVLDSNASRIPAGVAKYHPEFSRVV